VQGILSQAAELAELLEANGTCVRNGGSYWKGQSRTNRAKFESGLAQWLQAIALPVGTEDRASACGRALLPQLLGGIICCNGTCHRDIAETSGVPLELLASSCTSSSRASSAGIVSLPSQCTSSAGFHGAEASASFVLSVIDRHVLRRIASPDLDDRRALDPVAMPAPYVRQCVPLPAGYDVLGADGAVMAATGPISGHWTSPGDISVHGQALLVDAVSRQPSVFVGRLAPGDSAGSTVSQRLLQLDLGLSSAAATQSGTYAINATLLQASTTSSYSLLAPVSEGTGSVFG